MCFTNEPDRLAKLRAKKAAITVWKFVQTDCKTGLCFSQYDGPHDRVWWKKGTVVHPHRIRPPIKGHSDAGSGLYFYNYPLPRYYEDVIKARVQPEDIIGVNCDGSQVCAVAAFVLTAPNPDPTKMRVRYLNEQIREAKNVFLQLEEQIAAMPEQREALQQMQDEVKGLKG